MCWSSPHLRQVGLFEEYEHPSEGKMRRVRSHYSMQGIRESRDNPTQLIGQSTHKVLSELGYTEDEIGTLADSNIVKLSAVNS